jgi:SAM-dependent MidA family methyltransferase
MQQAELGSVSTRLMAHLRARIEAAGGWLPFDRFMALALYAPGLGYYANDGAKFGRMPDSGSDFITAPELSSLFGAALARQVGQALQASGTHEVWEFGAGSGALAEQLLLSLAEPLQRYTIVDLSGALRQRQQERLQRFGDRVQWVDALPDSLQGVLLGNEVLDAMPVKLLHWSGERWFERGVALHREQPVFADIETDLRPPVDSGFVPDSTLELHQQSSAFITTLAERLVLGAAFFIDYGFPEAEYYHPQRRTGTLMCHRAHRMDTDPLADLGCKDITAHVNFSAVALAGQDAGLTVLGYTTQAHFLLNCGLPELLRNADPRQVADAQKLISEHEMGELFKVIGFARGCSFDAIGFVSGDRSHRL